MPESRSYVTPDERDQLRRFVALVDEMSRSRFIETYRKQDHKVSLETAEPDAPRLTAPQYDWEDFVAFLTIFRQLAISKNERVYVFRITDIATRHASGRLREQLARMVAELKPLLEGKYQGMKLGRETPAGKEEISLTSYEILNALVNGQVFHSDKKHEPAVGFLNAVERWQYLWPVMAEIVIPALRAFIWLFHALRGDGILQDTDYPARCREPRPA